MLPQAPPLAPLIQDVDSETQPFLLNRVIIMVLYSTDALAHARISGAYRDINAVTLTPVTADADLRQVKGSLTAGPKRDAVSPLRLPRLKNRPNIFSNGVLSRDSVGHGKTCRRDQNKIGKPREAIPGRSFGTFSNHIHKRAGVALNQSVATECAEESRERITSETAHIAPTRAEF